MVPLNDFESGLFRSWRASVLGHFEEKMPAIFTVLTEPQPRPLLAADASDAQRTAAMAAANEWVVLDETAARRLLPFLGPNMQRQYDRFSSGRLLWDSVAHDYAEYQLQVAPLLEQQLRELRPNEGEKAADFCQRMILLRMDLEDVGRALPLGSVRDMMLNNLVDARPAWEGAVDGLRGIVADWPLEKVRRRLAEVEASKPALAPANFALQAMHARAVPAAADPTIAALHADVRALRARLDGQAGSSGSSPDGLPSEARPPKRLACYVCGSPQHRAFACPNRFDRRGVPPSPSGLRVALPVPSILPWVVDSGLSLIHISEPTRPY